MCDNDMIKSVLYDKHYTCPLCSKTFISKAIKSGKNQLLHVDDDLCAHYSLVNPVLYDVIVCPYCGYSFMNKSTLPLSSKQKQWLSAHFSVGHTTPHYSEYTTLQEAIQKHKMALFACITKKGKLSEQAYLALLTAWLYREAGDHVNELVFLERAYKGFDEAFSKESFPMAGMDDITMLYLLSALAFELDKKEESKLYLSKAISIHGCPERLKERIHTLKNKLHT